ncbi:MAG: helix-turn-helix domain-containing protein [archaeon]|jgi:predicted DNA binding protein
MNSDVKVLDLSIFHHDCFSQVTENYPGLVMKLVSMKFIRKSIGKNGYLALINVTGESKKQVSAFFSELKKHSAVVDVELLKSQANTTLAMIKVKVPTSSYDEIIASGALLFKPPEMKGGVDVHSIITTDFKSLKGVLKELHEIGDLKVTRIGDVAPEMEKDFLTEKQTDALRFAVNEKYYSWPRGATLDALAKKNRMKRRAYQEHLRKAESKLLPVLLRDYLGTTDLGKE